MNGSKTHAHITDMSDVQAIEWVDRTYHVRWVVPLAGNAVAAGLNLAAESRRRSALEDSRTRREPSATQPFDLVQGGKGLLLLFPVYRVGDFDGFVLAVFNAERWFRDALPGFDELAVKLVAGDEVVANLGGVDSVLTASAPIRILNQTWALEVAASNVYVEDHQSALPSVVLVTGLLLATLLGITMFSALVARANVAALNRNQHILQDEIARQQVIGWETH